MDWFLYDNDLRHERVNQYPQDFLLKEVIILKVRWLLSNVSWFFRWPAEIETRKKVSVSTVFSIKVNVSIFLHPV